MTMPPTLLPRLYFGVKRTIFPDVFISRPLQLSKVRIVLELLQDGMHYFSSLNSQETPSLNSLAASSSRFPRR